MTAPILGRDPTVDAVVAFAHKLQTPAQRLAYAGGIADSQAASGKPHLVIAPATLPDEQAQLLQDRGIVISSQTGAAFVALQALFDVALTDPLPPLAATEQSTRKERVLNEWDSMQELDAAGISTVPRARVPSADAAAQFAEAAAGPIVLKGLVEGIAHKSDVGLVHLDLIGAKAARTAHMCLQDDLARNGVAGGADAVVAQAMVRGGLEVIVGTTTEAGLGRFLLVGSGGRQAECIDDVHLWSIPVREERIRAELPRTAVGRILAGPRWGRPASLDELVDVLLKLQAHVTRAGDAVRAIEINPLSMTNNGAVALDALVISHA